MGNDGTKDCGDNDRCVHTTRGDYESNRNICELY